MMTVKEAAEKWGVCEKTALWYCQKGRIPGIQKQALEPHGWRYIIPDDAGKPARRKPGPPPKPQKTPAAPQTARQRVSYIRRHGHDRTFAEIRAYTGTCHTCKYAPCMRTCSKRACYNKTPALHRAVAGASSPDD